MDIAVSSNFERLLFDLYDRDGKALAALMAKMNAKKRWCLWILPSLPRRMSCSTATP